ncbi:uncharacterized protein OCT59_006080 [Rhizophagus irregularis]|uniref:F-box domain-containing protein n=2 Tax=Rhizophagus irregularis TaxID=588596 RepID=A0A015J0Y5_RHIIW|nr:hypothetical protein GLOIN_2v1881356 [Rhizophagus irregularis DAOM 181602=DAOM 197198]EXX60375.1 hypothetical protein RirG_180460 [Rhizophagus irregularis DAOM 197198w]PKY29539.1 hypothetical protein RhiirB3_530556 [Rhizophagus irregularis]POG64400.1 hypothetical protein GLOIN_2v1881356 [Rhizophagus irregularis DAOM 181602=DAOM 197198]UZO14627.1 hypothetical protein OCT59_006080 [Rhizophagus irregularis]GBC38372.1 hypothetical protein GLOIN_2v1881356 [Rhizophagus irregularis DAOM 181602=DAO|eukprot:XP_025171266.1 hypothetical protein GLOIN_2v1881356 [Rhizophagus irregularis DAOM 181602=DAOM 197198]
MSCSKIFSGDLPELTYKIIKYFQNDYSTLHSCILINRLWCRLTIPLLWENPFSIPTNNFNFIETYFKTKLNESKINNDSLLLPSNTLFNYPKFLKYLYTYKFTFCIAKWLETSKPKIGLYSVTGLNDMCISLFKIFIENEVNLHTLEIEVSSTYYNTCLDKILELILQNKNFIHNIKNLKLFIGDYDEFKLIKNRITEIINLQQNLKKILIGYDDLPSYQSLLLLKEYNCSNTLNTITFYHVNFNDIFNFYKIFEQLNVLESVNILYCSFLNTDFIQQIINLTKPFKLKSLFINELFQIESLHLLLQKSGDSLENFGFDFNRNTIPRKILLELFIKYCKNIKFLDLFEFEIQITYKIFDLIESIKKNLNYLSIHIWEDNRHLSIGNSIILQNLGQILPNKLEYINLSLVIKENDFKVFLENSQDIFINKLLIFRQGGSDDILPYIKKYIMKEKRVRYLAIENIKKRRELSDLKDIVKEFKLHNIRIQSYRDLSINFDDFTMNID